MDFFTIIGVIVGAVAVVVGMYFKHVPFSALNNKAAFFVIIVGTIGAVTIATPGNELKNIGKLFGILFGKRKFGKPEDVIEKLVGYADIARRETALSLEAKISEETDPFIIRGLQLLVDAAGTDKIYDSMNEDIAAMKERHAAGAMIFTQAGTYAPTLGVLGAVLGLIAALAGLGGDIEVLGEAISAAFVATLLGIFTGYVLWHPMANRLKRISKQEVLYKTIIMEGIVSIYSGTNPNNLYDDLCSYIPSSQRKPREAAEK